MKYETAILITIIALLIIVSILRYICIYYVLFIKLKEKKGLVLELENADLAFNHAFKQKDTEEERDELIRSYSEYTDNLKNMLEEMERK